MSEETNYPYEALRTFCASKPTEFDAFMRLWNSEHLVMQPEPLVSVPMTPIINEVSTVDERFQSDDDATLTVSEKPKRKRKVAVEDAGITSCSDS